jgi:hypothetical protein
MRHKPVCIRSDAAIIASTTASLKKADDMNDYSGVFTVRRDGKPFSMLVVVCSAHGNLEDTVLQVVALVQQQHVERDRIVGSSTCRQAARRRLRVVECDDGCPSCRISDDSTAGVLVLRTACSIKINKSYMILRNEVFDVMVVKLFANDIKSFPLFPPLFPFSPAFYFLGVLG